MPDPEVLDGSENKEAAPAKTGKPLNVGLIIAIVVGVFLLIGSGVAAFLLVNSLAKANRPASEEEASAPAKEEKAEKKSAHGESKKAEGGHGEGKKKEGGGHGEGKKSSAGGATMYSFDKPIIVNLAESNAERYLKVDVVLELDGEKAREEIESHLPQVQDLLISITSTKTMDDVSTLSGRNMLRQEMIDKMNALISEGQVKNVYFTEFVVQ